MSLVTRSTNASPEVGSIQRAPQVIGIAGENLFVAAPCYVDTDGTIKLADGTAANAKTKVAGFASRPANAGEAVTLYGVGAIFHYSDTDLTPGAIYYLATTAGRLDTATTTGDAVGVAQVMPDKRTIRVTRAI